jgi:hypothetical protein
MAVILTVNTAPAPGEEVEGVKVNELNCGTATVTGLLGRLSAVHDRNTAVTV